MHNNVLQVTMLPLFKSDFGRYLKITCLICTTKVENVLHIYRDL